MKYTFYLMSLLIAIFVFSCESSKIAKKNLKPYPDFLKEIKTKKADLSNNPLDQAKELLFEIINEKMPEYWSGTGWDFNGVSRIPGEGDIACGFFVTTLLVDAGFEIERVYLAQQPSSVMIKQLTKNIKNTGSFETLKDYILKAADHSVFIIGLDFHTGFITRDGDKIYFIHSNYIKRKGVTKEQIEFSSALKASKSFMIGSLTDNEELLKKWCK